jgi:hypothetical protein
MGKKHCYIRVFEKGRGKFRLGRNREKQPQDGDDARKAQYCEHYRSDE